MKNNNPKSTKKQYRVVYSRKQRFWGWFGLIMLFICGIMVGVGIGGNSSNGFKPAHASDASSTPKSEPQTPDTTQTCTIIEESLLVRLPNGDKFATQDDRIERAKIYANLSERGCPENHQKYYDLAKQELEIARALSDDEFNQQDTIEVVETYKRLNMQAAAEEIFEMAKELTNPTIDFILSVEKIINEQ